MDSRAHPLVGPRYALFWAFLPHDKKARVTLTLYNGERVKVWAVRVATRHVRVRGLYKGSGG